MMHTAKKILPLAGMVLLAACSSPKDLPKGKRISVIDAPTVSSAHLAKDFNISQPAKLSSWTQIGSNEKHLNQNIAINDTPKQLWQADFGVGSSKRNLLLATPVVQNGVIYTQDAEGTVRAFRLEDGKEIFKQNLLSLNNNDSSSGLNGAGLALDSKNLYALAGFGGVFALNAEDGEILWRRDFNKPIRTPPTLSQNLLFVQTIDNQLIALNASNGSELWRYTISAEDTVYAGGGCPVVDEGKQMVINAFSNGELQAFNAKIGYPIWSQNLVNTSFAPSAIHAVKASPVIDNHIVYAAGSNDKTVATDVETGDVLWQVPVGAMSSPLVDQEAVFMVSGNHELLALTKEDGRILWQTPLLEEMSLKDRRSVYVFSPLLLNGKLFVATSNGLLMRFKPQTGELISKDDIDKDLALQPITADGYLILTTQNAKILVFK